MTPNDITDLPRPARRKWSGRSFISLNLGLSFLVLILSSVVLYIMPSGRDAYWTNWRFWTLAKDQWGALHTVGGLGFVVFGLLHLIIYNWNAFWHYLVGRLRKVPARKAEIAGAVVLNAAIILACIYGWFPSSTIMGWGASLKAGWVAPAQQSPYGHAEADKLQVLAGRMGFDLSTAVKALEAKGLKVDPEKTVKAIASDNGLTPAQLFEMIAPVASQPGAAGVGRPAGDAGRIGTASPGGAFGGGGWGRKTVAVAAKEAGVEIATALERLEAKGIKASSGGTLREIADKAGLTPTEIAQIISGK
jgi:hypothetical protein